jgi:hypothetical protein
MNDVFPVGECGQGLEFFVRKPDREFSCFHGFVFMTNRPGAKIQHKVAGDSVGIPTSKKSKRRTKDK